MSVYRALHRKEVEMQRDTLKDLSFWRSHKTKENRFQFPRTGSCGKVSKWGKIREDRADLVRFVMQTEVSTISDDKIVSSLPGTGEGGGHPHKGIRQMEEGRVFLFAASQSPQLEITLMPK